MKKMYIVIGLIIIVIIIYIIVKDNNKPREENKTNIIQNNNKNNESNEPIENLSGEQNISPEKELSNLIDKLYENPNILEILKENKGIKLPGIEIEYYFDNYDDNSYLKNYNLEKDPRITKELAQEKLKSIPQYYFNLKGDLHMNIGSKVYDKGIAQGIIKINNYTNKINGNAGFFGSHTKNFKEGNYLYWINNEVDGFYDLRQAVISGNNKEQKNDYQLMYEVRYSINEKNNNIISTDGILGQNVSTMFGEFPFIFLFPGGRDVLNIYDKIIKKDNCLIGFNLLGRGFKKICMNNDNGKFVEIENLIIRNSKNLPKVIIRVVTKINYDNLETENGNYIDNLFKDFGYIYDKIGLSKKIIELKKAIKSNEKDVLSIFYLCDYLYRIGNYKELGIYLDLLMKHTGGINDLEKYPNVYVDNIIFKSYNYIVKKAINLNDEKILDYLVVEELIKSGKEEFNKKLGN